MARGVPRTVKRSHHQTGRTHKVPDKARRPAAMYPGKRLSKTGHTYHEYRKNRSDLSRRKRL